MRRRAFIAMAGAMLWANVVAAQPASPIIGYVSAASEAASERRAAAFREGLAATGYVDRYNAAIEYRWAEGQYERLPELVTDLLGRGAAVLVGAGLPAALAAKAATTEVPVVFASGDDAIGDGLVGNLSRPGGNVTGATNFFGELGAKRLELLRELAPHAAEIAVFVNPSNPNARERLAEVESGARNVSQRLRILQVSSESEIVAAFTALSPQTALLVGDDPFFTIQRRQFVELAARRTLPAIYFSREFTDDGGLMSYGADAIETYRQVGTYVGRILKGENAGALPVQWPTRFELVINLRAARSLGLTIPPALLARADEVIE